MRALGVINDRAILEGIHLRLNFAFFFFEIDTARLVITHVIATSLKARLKFILIYNGQNVFI
jgi:hypothetical protein